MALPAVFLVSVRSLYSPGLCVVSAGRTAALRAAEPRWCSTKARSSALRDATAAPQPKRDLQLLREFPDPKSLLNSAIARSLGASDLRQLVQYDCWEQAGVKRATVTLTWPCRIQEEGSAYKKIDAERLAAAAACQKLRDLGVIGPNNQLPRRRVSRTRGGVGSALHEDNGWTPREEEPSTPEAAATVSEALAMFPQPKLLLAKVVQVATSSNRIREMIQFRTSGGKLKRCELKLCWPEEMTFSAVASGRLAAERKAAALACMKLKDLELLDRNNNPLSHVQYHRQQVKEAGERERRPVTLEIPEGIERTMREYLTEFPVSLELQKVWEEEEVRAQQDAIKQEDDVDDDDAVMDAITGQPYRTLSKQEAARLSAQLQEQWHRADPQLQQPLPVDAHRERVCEAVRSSGVVVIAGETGCGKTTRIPRFLLEEQVRGGAGAHCNILVTQPRRISAVSVAQRVAQEMGPALKDSVGYQVRLESRPPWQSGGAVLFLTVGVLLKKLQGNASLQGISHVVVDEVHERDVHTDLLLALLRSCLRDRPDLKVVLMSATGDNQRLAEYFGGCPVVKVPGFMHPVREHYLEDVLRDMRRPLPVTEERAEPSGQWGKDEASPDPQLVSDVIEHIHKHGEPGAVLCFLPGWQEIKAVQEKLEENKSFSPNAPIVLPLHSSLSVADQQAVFQRPPVGRRKIVLATNIAETSVTIDDIVHVVDTGSHKEQNYDARTKVSCLDTVWISRSNVTQRKGRAGRCQPGQSYHLFPRKQLEAMSAFPVPEILRTPLESLVLQAKIHSPNCKAVDFLSRVLDSPDVEAVRDAVQTLQDIGVLDKTETLTPLGERVSCMSCDPRLGKVLVLSALFRCTLPLLAVAACLTRDPFLSSLQNRALVKQAKASLSGSSCSDFLVFSRAVLGWRSVQQGGAREQREDFLERYTLSRAGLRFINGLMSQFSENLSESSIVRRSSDCQNESSLFNQFSDDEQLMKAVLLAGLYPNLVQVKKGSVVKRRFHPNSVSLQTVTGPVLLHRSSVNRGVEDFPSRWLTFFCAVKSNGNVFMRDSSSVHPLALLLLTDCDITESVSGDVAEVSLVGHSLLRCRLSSSSWKLLWDLRTSVQTMIYRNLRDPSGAIRANVHQDTKLLALLVQLLNGVEAGGKTSCRHSDGETDNES